MSAEDFQPFPPASGLPSELDSGTQFTPGNRPASGARRATPGEVLSTGFQGAQNAGDFLGLDVEFAGSQDPSQFAADGLDLQGAPTTHVEGMPGQAYPPAAPGPFGDPVADPAQDFSQTPSSFEYGEDLGSEEELGAAPAEESGSRKSPLFAAVLVVAALGGAAYYFAPQYFPGHSEPAPEVASQPKPPRPQAEPTPDANATTPDSTPDDLALQPVDAGDAGGASSSELPVDPSSSLSAHTDPTSSTSSTLANPDSAVTPDAPEAAPDLLTTLLAGQGATPTSGFPDLAGEGFDWASEDQVELIWRGATIPMEAVRAPAKTLMPRVGNVRVFTKTGDLFDGRLYAVGQNRVWIDAAPGRIGLDGDHVERIDVLPPTPPGSQASEEVVAGKRVRVRVPGGMLVGRVLKVDGENVTMQLDDGGKVHVKSADVEDIGSGRAVVVRR